MATSSQFLSCNDYCLHLACLRTQDKSSQELPTGVVGKVENECTKIGVPRASWEVSTWGRLGLADWGSVLLVHSRHLELPTQMSFPFFPANKPQPCSGKRSQHPGRVITGLSQACWTYSPLLVIGLGVDMCLVKRSWLRTCGEIFIPS